MKFQLTKQFVILVIILWKLFAIHGNDVSQIVEIKNVLKYKLYFNIIRRRNKQKRRYLQDNHSKRTYLLLLILLAGDVETNPGPVSIPCPRCQQTFDRRSRLDNHISKQQLLTCGHCKKNFCSEQQVRQHIQTEHFGSGNGADPPLQPPLDLSTPIFGLTGYEVQPGY